MNSFRIQFNKLFNWLLFARVNCSRISGCDEDGIYEMRSKTRIKCAEYTLKNVAFGDIQDHPLTIHFSVGVSLYRDASRPR